MDNRIFNVNGSGDEMLKLTLSLVFLQRDKNATCTGWKQTKEHGLILFWSNDDPTTDKFPSPLNAEGMFPIVKSWLSCDFAKTVTLSEYCNNLRHDGHNTHGWQVYCSNWGNIGDHTYTICGIKPAYMWHGK